MWTVHDPSFHLPSSTLILPQNRIHVTFFAHTLARSLLSENQTDAGEDRIFYCLLELFRVRKNGSQILFAMAKFRDQFEVVIEEVLRPCDDIPDLGINRPDPSVPRTNSVPRVILMTAADPFVTPV